VNTMIGIVSAGLAAGMVHVLAGPDHLAAVAPLAADSGRRGSWRAGFSWGIGHTTGVFVVGLLALLLRGLLPIDALASWSERLVGVALVAVGLWGLRRATSLAVHSHPHTHDGHVHAHLHAHAGGLDAHGHGLSHAHVHASFGFGVLHGLAGSSHVLGILPALALPTTAASTTYLLAYGVGSVVAMTLFSSAVGFTAARAHSSGPRFHRGLLYAFSSAAILVGGAWLLI
jgi:hypothetical protein